MKASDIQSRDDYLRYHAEKRRAFKEKHQQDFQPGGKHYEYMQARDKASQANAFASTQPWQAFEDEAVLSHT